MARIRTHFLKILIGIVFGSSCVLLEIYQQVGQSRVLEEMATQNPQTGGILNKDALCKLPVLDPFDKSIQKYFRRIRNITCNNTQPYLTYIDDYGGIRFNKTETTRQHVKHLREPLTCYYSTIDRKIGDSDDEIEFGPEIPLTDGATFPRHDAVQVQCKISERSIYYNLHAYPKKLDRPISDSSREQLSVFIFFQDSASTGLFFRYLPKTTEQLQKMGMRIFHGHTKVGDNSRPNMVAALAGLRATYEQPDMPNELPEDPRRGTVDDWPLVWKNFSAKNYATAYIEDEPDIGVFHYMMPGFTEKPVDHSLRSFFLQQKIQGVKKQSSFCFRNTPNYAMQINYTLQLLRRYKAKRHFTASLFTLMTHEWEPAIASTDYLFLDFFKQVHSENLLENTITIIMSDHGHRFSDIRNTIVGLLEERMPMLGIIFPPWFLKKFPHIDQAVELNQKRLTAHFDIHQTLLDILNSDFDENEQLPSGTRGLSLFREVPINRTCTEAGIPTHFCVCTAFEALPTNNTEVLTAASAIIDTINERVATANYAQLCSNLTLRNVLRAENLNWNDYVRAGARTSYDVREYIENGVVDEEIKDSVDMKVVRVAITADPSGGTFEGTVVLRQNVAPLVTGDISRTNKYGDQSSCIKDFTMRKYCYCAQNYK